MLNVIALIKASRLRFIVRALFAWPSILHPSKSVYIKDEGGTSVIQINIHGKARDIKDEQIERGSALQSKFVLERFGFKNLIEQVQEANDFLHSIWSEACSGSDFVEAIA